MRLQVRPRRSIRPVRYYFQLFRQDRLLLYLQKRGNILEINYGTSGKTDVFEAVREATAKIKSPALLIVFSSHEALPSVTDAIKTLFPNVPCIGTGATSYFGTSASDTELIVIGFGKDVRVKTGVMRHLSVAPVYDLKDLKNAVSELSPGSDNSVCLEFCTNSEEQLVTSMNIALEARGVPLLGGSVMGAPEGMTSKVMVDGVLYEDACCYALIKSTHGKIRTYSENIYTVLPGTPRHIATEVNGKTRELIKLDGRPAADVYGEELGLSRDQIVDNVLRAPLGRIVGDQVFITSMYDLKSNGSLVNYKRINENDTISILQLQDYDQINSNTRDLIRRDNSQISFIFSVNCIYRHLLFTGEGYLERFLGNMSHLGPHIGVVGGGEQYKNQHVNQTMVCAVFE